MNARERVLAALEGSPEVRPGTAEQLVADLVADVLAAAIEVAREEGHRLEEHIGIEAARGARGVAYLLRRRADVEQGKGTREGELTPARLSAMKLAAFIGGAHNGRATTGGGR